MTKDVKEMTERKFASAFCSWVSAETNDSSCRFAND